DNGLAAIPPACQVYLVINAALSSAFVSSLEGDKKRGILYFALLAPCAQLVFAIACASVGLPSAAG
ncbi:MAG: hypothetical protein NT051_00625, partial [Candidatus Micrarchaeota archaeon]|nr:hypothetical protein [Candidatus Micrarchaeota archaeon]